MKARVRIALLAGCVLALLFAPSRAGAVSLQSIGPTFDQPIFATSPPGDPRLFVVERPGFIQVLHNGTVSQFLDIHDRTTNDGERGLLSMAFDPNYASNGLFYVYYTGDGPNSGGTLGDIHIDEFHVSSNPNVADPASRRTVWTFSHGGLQPQRGAAAVRAGRLTCTSRRATTPTAPTHSRPGTPTARSTGSIHMAPATAFMAYPRRNPFAGVPGATQEIWGMGLRNPFRFSFDHLTGDLVIGDVGEVSHEEVDFSPASTGGGRGANYGWPCREGFSAGPGGCGGSFVNPVFDYPHEDPGGNVANGCAIIGGYVYRGSQAPEIAGRYLYADLCTAQLRSLRTRPPVVHRPRGERRGCPGKRALVRRGRQLRPLRDEHEHGLPDRRLPVIRDACLPEGPPEEVQLPGRGRTARRRRSARSTSTRSGPRSRRRSTSTRSARRRKRPRRSDTPDLRTWRG